LTWFTQHSSMVLDSLLLNGDFHIHAGLDLDRRDLLHDVAWAVEVDPALMDSHFEPIPRVGTFTARRLSCGDVQHFSWKSDWPLGSQLLFLGTTEELAADFFQSRDVAGAQRNSDLSEILTLGCGLLHRLNASH